MNLARMTPKFLKKLRKIAATYDVRVHVHFTNTPVCSGHAHSDADTVCIFYSLNTSEETILSTLFHEIGHCVAFHDGRFLPYHTGRGNETYMKRFALRAELYVDHWAEKEFNKTFPSKTYHKAYRTKRDRDFLLNWIFEEGGNSGSKCYPLKAGKVKW